MQKVKWYKRPAFLIPVGLVIGIHIVLYLIDNVIVSGGQNESELLVTLLLPEIYLFFMVYEPVSAWWQYTDWSWWILDVGFFAFVVVGMAFIYGLIGLGVVGLYRKVQEKLKK